MAAEGKDAEVKTGRPKSEIEEEAAVEETPEPPLKYKKWFLKVSVHCEGCKRKVKKILHNIEGVYTADVDLKQQKATVIGNVDAETLIKKLVKKTGRHAELWPEKAEHKDKKKGKSKNKDKDKQQQQSDQESSEEGEKDNKEKLKNEVLHVQDPSKMNEINKVGGGSASKAAEGGGATGKSGRVQIKEVTINEVKATVTSPAGSQSPAADKKGGGESENVAEKSGSGGSSKKKKNKGQKGNNNANGDKGEHSGNVPTVISSPHGPGQGPVLIHTPANHCPPPHHLYDYPTPRYYTPTVQAVNYSTAYPRTSYGASYYAPSHEYAYMRHATASDLERYYYSQPSDSFEFLSDENPNACSIM